MATLILTAVGTAVGGPIGGTIGSVLGQAIDARLFAPKGREGPRLSDLRVQTSSYGTMIPRIYGRMRVAGTVIWSTDLIEHRQRQSAGKGRGSVTSFSYSASFAVALSSRPIIGVRRIWAEGNVLRGAAGDFKSPTGFRLHSGDEDQPLDPLIAAAEGLERSPAYRGMAYALFEDMDLSPFGNRIPSLSFEVEADTAPVSLDVPMRDLCGLVEPVVALPQVEGMALAEVTRGEALSTLTPLVPVDRLPGGRCWRLGDAAVDPLFVLDEPADDRGRARVIRRSAGQEGAPRQIGVAVFAPDRDFQLIIPTAQVAGGHGPVQSLALPIAADAATAKGWAGQLAIDAAMTQCQEEWPMGFAGLALWPGTDVILPGGGGARRISERQIEGAAVRLTLATVAGSSAGAGPGAPPSDAGRVAASPDLAIGTTRAWLFDLPVIDGVVDGRVRVALAAGSAGEGWRQAGLRIGVSAGAPPGDAGSVKAMAVLGEVVAINGLGTPWLFDDQGSVVVELLRESMLLSNANDAALLAGANLAMAGGELFQFGRAEPLADRRWRLTRLLRGRLGTEDMMAQPAAGRGFALIDDPALMILPSAMTVGGTIELIGQGDLQPISLTVTEAGRAQRPLSPSGLLARWQNDGGLQIIWQRRSRTGFGWADGVDAPMDERAEHYRIAVTGDSPVPVEPAIRETAVPHLLLSAQELATWRGQASAMTIIISVQQIGDHGVSPPATMTIAV